MVDNLIQQQRACGHEIHLITRWKQWKAAWKAGERNVLPLPPRLKFDKVPFRSVGPRWPVALAARLHQMRHQFDVWHIHWLYPTGWMVYEALRKSGVPVVMTAHGADLQVDKGTHYGFRQYPKHDRRVRSLIGEAETLTAISDSIAQTYLGLGARPEVIHRIDNGVDVANVAAAKAFRDATRAYYGISQDSALILTVGRNQPSKGFQFIPAMLRCLKDRGRKVAWFVVGQDSEQLAPALEGAGVSGLAHLLPQFGPNDQRRFPPEGLARLYAAADIFAFPSLTEGAPLVAIEAMAAGLPVVGHDVQGIRDVVTHDTDGLLCLPGDVEAMAGAICQIIDDKEFAQRLSREGLLKAKRHDWSEIAGQYLALYREVIEATRS